MRLRVGHPVGGDVEDEAPARERGPQSPRSGVLLDDHDLLAGLGQMSGAAESGQSRSDDDRIPVRSLSLMTPTHLPVCYCEGGPERFRHVRTKPLVGEERK